MLTPYDVFSGIRLYSPRAFHTLIQQVEVPVVVTSTVYMARHLETILSDSSWDGEDSIDSVIISIGEQFFKVDLNLDSWGDEGHFDVWNVNEVKAVTKIVTAYRQVPYEKEVTEYL